MFTRHKGDVGLPLEGFDGFPLDDGTVVAGGRPAESDQSANVPVSVK
jgi:hypothetical protein